MRESYGCKARERDLDAIRPWKADERLRFLNLLQAEGRRTLLELGAGPGKDGAFFRDRGLDVICIDLSPEMVALCESKGLAAREMDLADLDFPLDTFDAVYAVNCLLHVPDRTLAGVLRGVRDVLRPGGLFYLGVYGGIDHEGVWEDDSYEPKRFFSFRTDERMREIVGGTFEIHAFRRVALDGRGDGLHFQSPFLRKRRRYGSERAETTTSEGEVP
ncbi:MAG: class I SAM-dependent methyltransferase [Actinomycetota bacterium]|nr:class I SAM-dependent methyltransferase [Actinomycetota bacterium]